MSEEKPIQLLDPNVINQVAAGEVIERPSAVVKELIENSIDAGATHIEIAFRDAGKTSIVVRDNGSGMSADNAEKSLQRHATSKISKIEDLHQIHSFGFRGEAIPSIASISRFHMKTRASGNEIGTEIQVDAGNTPIIRKCACPIGTEIQVEQLFKNVPARRKFLKSDATETNHIIQTVRLMALDFPEIHFSLKKDQRLIFDSPIQNSLEARIKQLWGADVVENFLFLDDSADDFRIWGYVFNPRSHALVAQEMLFFINRRCVHSKPLQEMLIQSYADFLPRARTIPCFLFIDLPTEWVDVNVHPTKREVRLSHLDTIRNHIQNSISHALKTLFDSPISAQKNSSVSILAPELHSTPHQILEPKISHISFSKEEKSKHIFPKTSPASDTFLPSGSTKISVNPQPKTAPQSTPQKELSLVHSSPPKPETTTTPSSTQNEVLGWEWIGFLDPRTALFKSESGVIFFDIYAAWERITYEKMTSEKDSTSQQILLFPIRLQGLHLHEDAKSILLQLKELGFEIESFGEQTYRVTAIPSWIASDDVEKFIRDSLVLDRKTLAEYAREKLTRLAANYLSRRTIYHEPAEVMSLVSKLMACQNPLKRPSGGTIFFEFSRGEIARRWQ